MSDEDTIELSAKLTESPSIYGLTELVSDLRALSAECKGLENYRVANRLDALINKAEGK